MEKQFSVYTKPTYRRKVRSPYIPKAEHTNIQLVKSRRRLYERIRKLEEKRASLSLRKPSDLKGFENLPKEQKKQVKRDRVKVDKIRKTKQVMADPFEKPKGTTKPPLPPIFTQKNTIYRDNIISSIREAFPEEMAEELIEALYELTDDQFTYYYMTNPETISYIYHDPATLKVKFDKLLDAFLEASME